MNAMASSLGGGVSRVGKHGAPKTPLIKRAARNRPFHRRGKRGSTVLKRDDAEKSTSPREINNKDSRERKGRKSTAIRGKDSQRNIY